MDMERETHSVRKKEGGALASPSVRHLCPRPLLWLNIAHQWVDLEKEIVCLGTATCTV